MNNEWHTLEADWLKVAALINPTTYVLEGMRAVMINGWGESDIWKAFMVIILFCVATISFSAVSARQAVSRG